MRYEPRRQLPDNFNHRHEGASIADNLKYLGRDNLTPNLVFSAGWDRISDWFRQWRYFHPHMVGWEVAMQRPTGSEIISVLVPAFMLVWCLASVA